jgi:hypothetical protein
VPEIVTDPDVPGPARRELKQAPLSALLGFSDSVPELKAPGRRAASKDIKTATETTETARKAARFAAGGSVAFVVLAVLLTCIGVLTQQPDLVLGAMFSLFPCAVVSALIASRNRVPVHEMPRRWRAAPGAVLTYHRRYVVPELDLHDAGRERWRRARAAAKSILAAEAIREGLIDTVEIAAVLPYHLWDIAERLALMSATERRLPAILRGVDTNDSEIQAVLGPQRRVHDLAVADVEQRIGRLEEFAALAAKADSARKRQRAIAELADLNPDYEELLIRLGEPGNALTVTGHSGDELRAVAAAADDAVRRANEAGRALVIPSAAGQEPVN